MKTALWLLNVCLLGCSTICLAEGPTGLGKSFDSAVTGARNLAERQKLTTILVRVAAAADGVANPQQENDLKQLEQLLVALLESPDLQAKPVAAGEETTLDAGQARLLLAGQQARLLLTADLLQQERKTQVQLALYTPEKRLWLKQVTIQGAPQQVSQTLKQAGQTQMLAQNTVPAQNLATLTGWNQNCMAAVTGTSALGALNTLGNLNNNVNNLGGSHLATNNGKTTSSAPTQSGSPSGQQQSVNQKVLQFALDNQGKQVGNGECWTLANDALIAAGAEPALGYTFGKEAALGDLQPGDILQFTSAEFQDGNTYYMMGSPNHTAVVKSISGTRVSLLHQNFNGDKTVSELSLDLNTLTDGQIQAYRPQPRGGAGNGPTGNGPMGNGASTEIDTTRTGERNRNCPTDGNSGPATNVIINVNVNTNVNIINSGNTTLPAGTPEPTATP